MVVSAVAVAGAMRPGTAGASGSTIAGAARMAESSSAGAGRVGTVVPAPRFAASATAGTGRIIIDWPAAGPPPLVAGATVAATLSHLGMAVLDVPDVAAALTAYRHLPGVAWAEADRPFSAAGTPDVAPVAAGTPDDPLFPEQWNLQSGPDAARQSIDWAAAYPQAQGSGALVAVLDTGFETGGSDQPANIRTDLARSFVPGTTTAADDNGHGTFVTDIIAEATDNAAGTAGIAPGAGIVPVKVLGADGTGDLSIVAEGIDYATSIGATVINLSLAGEPERGDLCRRRPRRHLRDRRRRDRQRRHRRRPPTASTTPPRARGCSPSAASPTTGRDRRTPTPGAASRSSRPVATTSTSPSPACRDPTGSSSRASTRRRGRSPTTRRRARRCRRPRWRAKRPCSSASAPT